MADRQTDTPLVLSSRLVTLSAASICAIPKDDVRQCAGRSMPRESSRPTDAATLEVQGRDRGEGKGRGRAEEGEEKGVEVGWEERGKCRGREGEEKEERKEGSKKMGGESRRE
jgi:hypothetical protein